MHTQRGVCLQHEVASRPAHDGRGLCGASAFLQSQPDRVEKLPDGRESPQYIVLLWTASREFVWISGDEGALRGTITLSISINQR